MRVRDNPDYGLGFPEKLADVDPQCGGNPLEHFHCGIALRTFHSAQISLMDVRALRQVLLSEAPVRSQSAQI